MNNSPICKTFVLSNYFFRDNNFIILTTKPLKSNKSSLKTNHTPYC